MHGQLFNTTRGGDFPTLIISNETPLPSHGHGHGHGHAHGHGHGHGHGHAGTDCWTILSAAGATISGYINDTYWLASIADCVYKLCGGTQQADDALPLSYGAIAFGASAALLTAGGATYAHWKLNRAHQTRATSPTPSGQLATLQQMALACDWASHTGDIAAPIVFIVDLATNGNLSVARRAMVSAAATVWGIVTSKANVRTCRAHMAEPSSSLSLP